VMVKVETAGDVYCQCQLTWVDLKKGPLDEFFVVVYSKEQAVLIVECELCKF